VQKEKPLKTVSYVRETDEHNKIIIVDHVIRRRLYSTGGVMAHMNNAIFQIVKREFVYPKIKERTDPLCCKEFTEKNK